MTAQPVPPSPTPHRDPEVTEALTALRSFGVEQLHRFGGKRSGKALERVLHYVASLEQSERSERQRRTDFEAGAEGEFLELRLQVRAWQGYAVQVEERRNVLAVQLRELLASLQALANGRWWRRRERREACGDAVHWRWILAHTLSQPEPTPPAVDLDG